VSETTEDLEVTVEDAHNHSRSRDHQYDEFTVGGKTYYFRPNEDSAESIRKEAKHLNLIADYLESDAQVERLKAKARRKAIAARYGIKTLYADDHTNAMIDRIMELEEGLPKPAAPKLVKRPATQAADLLDLDDNGGH
jgi:hypothetical protein